MKSYYLNLTENKILYDERKKRFIYLKDASREQAGLFNRSHFKWQRPDLYGGDQIQFQQDLKNGQSYLRSLMYFNKMEMRRLSRALGNNANRYIYPIMDDYLRQYQVDAIRTERLWTWRDSTKIVEYFREHVRRTQKYGLDNGASLSSHSKEAFKQREEELVQYFLHEMRKRPVTA